MIIHLHQCFQRDFTFSNNFTTGPQVTYGVYARLPAMSTCMAMVYHNFTIYGYIRKAAKDWIRLFNQDKRKRNGTKKEPMGLCLPYEAICSVCVCNM